MSDKRISENSKLKDNLKEKGYKLTPQRRAVVDIISENEGKHLTAEEIYDLVKVDCPEIGLATVYRTLILLEDIGLVSHLDLGDNCNRYELVHENENHQHHHLICLQCSKVIEVEGDLLEELESNIENKYNFKIENHSVKFFGLCSECASKQK
ncbi:Fur family transcriptional regulator [Clostridium oryzae]|uniref:Ferric uptake regulation protein n=1 Tax=Clostridium oryzae TaxID=1450648 RepID=A0A1V4IV12_9CLOT|nr:Fur family transcriptional regulator [Clostridium oryzae]OPJ63625.1 ferric uptake regulation protein [Clostridium oryzae]